MLVCRNVAAGWRVVPRLLVIGGHLEYEMCRVSWVNGAFSTQLFSDRPDAGRAGKATALAASWKTRGISMTIFPLFRSDAVTRPWRLKDLIGMSARLNEELEGLPNFQPMSLATTSLLERVDIYRPERMDTQQRLGLRYLSHTTLHARHEAEASPWVQPDR